jgi:hypothetical protein
MANPCALKVVYLLLLGSLISCQQQQVHAADCPKPMKPVTKSQAKKLRPHGTFMFTDDPSKFSPLLPAKLITEKEFFNFKIKPECTDGKTRNQYAVSYTVNGTAIEQNLNEYPPESNPCKK